MNSTPFDDKTTTDDNCVRPAWIPLLTAIGIVGLVLAPLLVGYEPVGWDPDLLYRPLKGELANALREGRLPYWSDYLGLGVPLVAESHVAAFYPPNWVAYRFLDVHTAYRLLMWLHFCACAAATFAYARTLGIAGWGSALAAVAFSLGGFQAAHACHEPFYTLMPYLPLTLLMAERYLMTGRPAWLAGLALSWGTQLLLGHFQIQMWTGGLVALTGLARLIRGQTSRKRAAWLSLALGWGLTVASVQLILTSELMRVSEFKRPTSMMLSYALSPGHLAQWALPEVYRTRHVTPMHHAGEPYWNKVDTTPEESTTYVGVLALIFACIALGNGRRGDFGRLSLWIWISALATLLATLPRWWPEGYLMMLKLPGLGWFRAPGRYMALTNLGVALLAGRGLDLAVAGRPIRRGLLLASALGLAALIWSFRHLGPFGFREILGAETLVGRYALAALSWSLALGVIFVWRIGRAGAWLLPAVAAIELGALFYSGPTLWGREIAFPGSSPIVARLRQEPEIGLIAGRLQNLTAPLHLTAARPLLGLSAPPPTNLLEPGSYWVSAEITPVDTRWQRRFGVTHGVWTTDDVVPGVEVIAEDHDDVLSALLETGSTSQKRDRWRLVRYGKPFPPAWVATRARLAAGWGPLYSRLAYADLPDEAWFLPEDRPPEAKPDPSLHPDNAALSLGMAPEPDLDLGPRATSTKIVGWNGRSGTVEHDGSCVLILRRAYYPGWRVRINDGPEKPVSRVGYSLQGVVLPGQGPSRITLSYRPSRLGLGMTLSVSATLAALVAVGLSGWTSRSSKNQFLSEF